MKRRAQLINRHRAPNAKKIKSVPSAKRHKSNDAKRKLKSHSSRSIHKPSIRTKSAVVEAPALPKIVRIMGRGQFKINSRVLKRLNQLDTAMVSMVSKEKPDDIEFKKRLTELTEIVVRDGKPLPTKEMLKSDIILPSAALPLDEAKKLFAGEGVIPQFN